MKFTKIISMSATTLMLINAGTYVAYSTNIISSQQVKASASFTYDGYIPKIDGKLTDDGDIVLNGPEWRTKTAIWDNTKLHYNLNGHNNIKFHYWKKPKRLFSYGGPSYINGYDMYSLGSGSNGIGAGFSSDIVYYIGYVTVNGLKFYIGDTKYQSFSDSTDVTLVNAKTFEKPVLTVGTTHDFPIYGLFNMEHGTKVDITMHDHYISKGSAIMIYKNSRPITIALPNEGTKSTYIPVAVMTPGYDSWTGLVDMDDIRNYTSSKVPHIIVNYVACRYELKSNGKIKLLKPITGDSIFGTHHKNKKYDTIITRPTYKRAKVMITNPKIRKANEKKIIKNLHDSIEYLKNKEGIN